MKFNTRKGCRLLCGWLPPMLLMEDGFMLESGEALEYAPVLLAHIFPAGVPWLGVALLAEKVCV